MNRRTLTKQILEPLYRRAGGTPLLLLIICFFSGCSENPILAGDGDVTETGNPVSGIIVNPDGSPAEAEVKLIPADYSPVAGIPLPDSLISVTDSNGSYRFSLSETGTYNLSARNLKKGTRLLITGIQVSDDTVDVPDNTLREPGTVVIPSYELAGSPEGFIYIPGTDVYREVSEADISSGSIVLDSVPAGTVPVITYAERSDPSVTTAAAREVEVAPSATVNYSLYSTWQYSRKVFLNTSASGANVPGDVYGFPVLLRLKAENFDFSQPRSDGGDIRFSRPDGSPLFYEIERWNRSADNGDIWIRVDTIHGYDDTQYINLHWGNPDAQDKSNSYAVFHIDNGFAGVWHIAENDPDTVDNELYRNAVEDDNHGDDRINGGNIRGIIAQGHNFRVPDYIRVTDPTMRLKPASGVTLSGWMNVDEADTLRGTMATMGISYGMRLTRDGNILFFVFNNGGFHDCFSTDTTVRDSIWHHVAGTYDGTQMKVYFDGELMNTVPLAGSVDYNAVYPNNEYQVRPHFFIGMPGAAGRELNFQGSLDEIRVSGKARSADWIKLIYQSQKVNSDLVQMK